MSSENTLDTAVWAAKPRAVAGKPSISFLSVINFSNFFVESKTFSPNFWDSFANSCAQIKSKAVNEIIIKLGCLSLNPNYEDYLFNLVELLSFVIF